MKKIIVKINMRNLNAIVRKHNFRQSGGQFNTYQFIGMKFETDKNNTAIFYESTLVSKNSWTNFPGIKIWENNQEGWTKEQVLNRIEGDLNMYLDWASQDYSKVEFKLIGF